MSKSTLKLLSGALILASVLMLPKAASSQSSDTAPADSLELDQVVVTASKIQQTLRETTKPVQIIDRAEIEDNAGRTLSQILNQQSGIRVNDSFGAPSNSRILYMQGAAATNTLVLIDGLAINDPSGTGGLFDLRLLSTENIERIEIIKGSQSTLYGTDAIAGVINIITRKGDAGPLNGNAQLSYGSYSTFNGHAGVNGTLNSTVQYSASYSRESSDGVSAAENISNSGTYGDDGFLMDAFNGRIDIAAAPNMTISPTIRYTNYAGDYDGGAFMDADNEFDLRMLSPGVQFKYGTDRYNLNADYSYTRTERSFQSAFGTNEFEGRFHNVDIFGDANLNSYVKFLAGINVQDLAIPGMGDVEGRSATITSPYATLYLKDVLKGFNTELGFRLNNHSEYGSNSTFSVAPSYRPVDNIKLFTSLTTGFKAPTLDELYGPFGANEELDPQTSTYFNLGSELYLMNQTLKVSAQFFVREIEDLIIYAGNSFINRDRQNDRGIELSADWMVFNRLSIGGWYNYLDGEITTEGENGQTSEDNLIRRPAHSIGFRAGVTPLDNLTFRLNGEYNGERSDIYFNPNNGFAAEDVTLDPYLLINLFAEYSFADGQFSVFADAKNLLDSDFTEVYGFNTMGTNLMAGVKVNF